MSVPLYTFRPRLRPMKYHKTTAKLIYSKNGAIIEAGEVKDFKKVGCPKCDTLYLKLSKKDSKTDTIIYMRPDEMVGLAATLSWAVWTKWPK